MTIWRMPIFTWSIFVTSILILIAFPVLTAALVGLGADREFGAHVFEHPGPAPAPRQRRGHGRRIPPHARRPQPTGGTREHLKTPVTGGDFQLATTGDIKMAIDDPQIADLFGPFAYVTILG